jgi:hypothetical protein
MAMPAAEETVVTAVAARGDDVLALALGHEGEEYVFGARAPLTNPDWRGPWDCAEFASWCTYQATGVIYGAEPTADPVMADPYTGYWAQHARMRGRIVSVQDAAEIAGALLLREPRTGRTGHIAISDGEGGTIEAHSTATGVGRHRVAGRRWDFGVLVPGIRYFRSDAPVDLGSEPDVLRVSQPLMRGPRVEAVQRALAAAGFAPGRIDSIYGAQTADAVMRYQAASGLVPDGEVGPATRAALALD